MGAFESAHPAQPRAIIGPIGGEYHSDLWRSFRALLAFIRQLASVATRQEKSNVLATLKKCPLVHLSTISPSIVLRRRRDGEDSELTICLREANNRVMFPAS